MVTKSDLGTCIRSCDNGEQIADTEYFYFEYVG
jgi:hypothetical protein